MTYFFKRFELILGIGSLIILGISWMNIPELINVFAILVSILMLLNFLFFKQIILKAKFRFTFIPNRVFSLYGFSATGIAIVLIGVVFKQLFLEGSNFLLICGIAMLGISTIIHTLIYSATKKRNAVKVMKRMLVYLIVASFFYFVPNDLFVYLNLRKYPEYAELVKQSLDDPDNLELRIKLKEAKKNIKKGN